MTQIRSPHATRIAGGQENIGTLERTDEMKCTPWQDELQLRTRGTSLYGYCRLLEPADAFALLLHVRGRI